MPTLRNLGEVEVIRRLAAARGSHGLRDDVRVDAGDDAAIVRVRPGRDLVVTTDAFVEGRHYQPEWASPARVGSRLALANVSDCAAMAAEPRWATVSMGVRAEHDVESLEALQSALGAALAREGAVLVGGNLVAVEGAEWFDLTLMGEVEPGRAWTRGGARPGDRIAVTGSPGRAGAGFRLAHALGTGARAEPWRPLLDAWLAPVARARFARALAASAAVTAAIDISDGLAGDLARLCEASGVGADLDAAAFPPDEALARAAEALGVPLEVLRLGPSDDYELLLAVEPEAIEACARMARGHDVSLAFIGRATDAPGVLRLCESDSPVRAIEAGGFDHFSDSGS